jgi:hypothetical protein
MCQRIEEMPAMKNQFINATIALVTIAMARSIHAQEPAAPAEGPKPQKIVVESVARKVQYVRDGQTRRVERSTELKQGDRLVAQAGAVCKLEFQHPTSGAALAGVIIEGYTELTIAEAFLQEGVSRTKLEVPQGIVKAGVVKTAVPPSFLIVTPRDVVAVRGTEIKLVEVSNDFGDFIHMGRLGVIMVHDSMPHFRSVRAGQGTEKLLESERRLSALLRAIEAELLSHRVILYGPHRRGLEVAFDRESFDLVEFPFNIGKSEGNALYERDRNMALSGRGKCPGCQSGP